MQNDSAYDAKARFGQLLDTARRDPWSSSATVELSMSWSPTRSTTS
jgi:hypothetical protein